MKVESSRGLPPSPPPVPPLLCPLNVSTLFWGGKRKWTKKKCCWKQTWHQREVWLLWCFHGYAFVWHTHTHTRRTWELSHHSLYCVCVWGGGVRSEFLSPTRGGSSPGQWTETNWKSRRREICDWTNTMFVNKFSVWLTLQSHRDDVTVVLPLSVSAVISVGHARGSRETENKMV